MIVRKECILTLLDKLYNTILKIFFTKYNTRGKPLIKIMYTNAY